MWLWLGGAMLGYGLGWRMRKTHTVYTQLDVSTDLYVGDFEVCQNFCFSFLTVLRTSKADTSTPFWTNIQHPGV